MQERGRRTGRRQGLLAASLLALGALLVSTSVASASMLVGAHSVITFWNNNDVVTLNTPSMCPTTASNPTGSPTCEWMLFVNEPDIPAQTTVGTAIGGLSAILTVPYPANFCGVLQADVEVGPPPWRLLYGHQALIQTGNCNCATSQATSTVVPTDTSGTGAAATPTPTAGTSSGQTQVGLRPKSLAGSRGAGAQRHRVRPFGHRLTKRSGEQVVGTAVTQATSGTVAPTTTTTMPPGIQTIGQTATCEPITAGSQTVPAATVPFTGSASTVPASTQVPTTLPFTGLDVQPLAVVGVVFILLGLGVLTTFEQKRNALCLAGRSTAWYSTRAALWLLGD